jgi:hypothetical protein
MLADFFSILLTDEGDVVLMVRQKSEYRCVVTKQLQARYP